MSARNGGASLAFARQRMLDVLRRHVSDDRVIDAMAAVPRERFVPEHLAQLAYEDRALPIGEGQTISQPLIVALMAEALQLSPDDRVLEVGSGSGYAAAVLAQLARAVIGVELIPALCRRSSETLGALHIENVRIFAAGAQLGRPDDAPFDAILVSAGAPNVPRTLLDQLADGGRLVIPIGPLRHQELVRATRTPHGVELMRLGPCAFVPLIGEDAWDSDSVSRRSKLP
jgi:protein-L-isoaspartate(D-aspartate) O-methyltransferase